MKSKKIFEIQSNLSILLINLYSEYQWRKLNGTNESELEKIMNRVWFKPMSTRNCTKQLNWLFDSLQNPLPIETFQA